MMLFKTVSDWEIDPSRPAKVPTNFELMTSAIRAGNVHRAAFFAGKALNLRPLRNVGLPAGTRFVGLAEQQEQNWPTAQHDIQALTQEEALLFTQPWISPEGIERLHSLREKREALVRKVIDRVGLVHVTEQDADRPHKISIFKPDGLESVYESKYPAHFVGSYLEPRNYVTQREMSTSPRLYLPTIGEELPPQATRYEHVTVPLPQTVVNMPAVA